MLSRPNLTRIARLGTATSTREARAGGPNCQERLRAVPTQAASANALLASAGCEPLPGPGRTGWGGGCGHPSCPQMTARQDAEFRRQGGASPARGGASLGQGRDLREGQEPGPGCGATGTERGHNGGERAGRGGTSETRQREMEATERSTRKQQRGGDTAARGRHPWRSSGMRSHNACAKLRFSGGGASSCRGRWRPAGAPRLRGSR